MVAIVGLGRLLVIQLLAMEGLVDVQGPRAGCPGASGQCHF